MKHKRITSKNFGTDLKSNDDVVPVRGKHYNDMVDDIDAHIPRDGVGKFDSIEEYTSGSGVSVTGLKQDTIAEKTPGAGVTVDGVLLKDGEVTTDILNEKTSDAGVTVDGVLLKDGIVAKVVSATATTAGTGTGQLAGASQFVKVYATGTSDVINLPAISDALVGTVIRGFCSNSGCEIRTFEQATGTSLNNITGPVEAAIPVDTTFRIEAVSATRWLLTSYDKTGAVAAIIPDSV